MLAGFWLHVLATQHHEGAGGNVPFFIQDHKWAPSLVALEGREYTPDSINHSVSRRFQEESSFLPTSPRSVWEFRDFGFRVCDACRFLATCVGNTTSRGSRG